MTGPVTAAPVDGNPVIANPVIDCHGHLAVPAADALVAGAPGFDRELAAEQRAHAPDSLAANRAQLARLRPRLTEVSARLADLDAMGVDAQVVGPMPMHHHWADRELTTALARTTNEAVADHCAKAPDRLYGLGTLPLQHPDLAVAELDRAVGSARTAASCPTGSRSTRSTCGRPSRRRARRPPCGAATSC